MGQVKGRVGAIAGAAVVLAGLLTGMSVASPPAHAHRAADAAAPFGCRASAARVALGGLNVEPVVAHAPTYPCADDSHGVASVDVPNAAPLVSAGPAGAFTYATGSRGGSVAPGAAAVAAIQAVNIPTGSGTITVVGPVEAYASYACVRGGVVGSAQSTLDVIYVNGQSDKLPAPGAPATIPLGGGAYVAVNERIQTSTSLTERVLDVHLADGAEVIAGEAKVTDTGGTACAGTEAGVPPGLEICPPGSTLDIAAQECVITGQGKPVYVTRPFKGPTGGRVYTLGQARRRYRSPCLSGRGSAYVLVATRRGQRVVGTPQADRILARGAYERVIGLDGNDCIDGSAAHQRIYDGNGQDRVYGGPGTNRIAVENGRDYVNGRSGSDWITAGNGADTVYGGRGKSRIDVGLGHDRIYGGPGRNRIWAIGSVDYIKCGSGKHNFAFMRRGAVKFARAHGCQRIYLLR